MWKPVVGYEDSYEVSDEGVVRSRDRIIKGGAQIRGRTLRQLVHHKNRYCSVQLCKDGKATRTQVHRIVAQAFIPNPLNLPMVNHCDKVRTNNRVSNLEWVTRQENMDHAADVILRGEQCHTAKLTEEKVREMRQRYDNRESIKSLAAEYGVTYAVAQKAIRRHTWRHVV